MEKKEAPCYYKRLSVLLSRKDEVSISKKQLMALVESLGSNVTDPTKAIALLSLTEQAFEDVDWLPVSPEGMRYVNPNDPRQILRTQAGFPAAYDPMKKGWYVKLSQNGNITYVPMAGNPTLEKIAKDSIN